jgi:hypothetical protein
MEQNLNYNLEIIGNEYWVTWNDGSKSGYNIFQEAMDAITKDYNDLLEVRKIT